MTTNDNTFYLKKPVNFLCNLCDFKCSYNKDYQRHINTNKHKNNVLATNNNTFSPKKPETTPKIYSCKKCEKIFTDRTGLWRHTKKCSNKEIFIDGINIKDKDALVIHLLKQNGELQHKLIDLSMSSKHTIKNSNNNNCNTTNNTNNTFNLQFFLNETCKDAMNITDFVSSIKVSLDDLEHTGRKGYIEGISNIIINKLNNLEQCFRPIHCSDYKREIFNIKNNNDGKRKPTINLY